MHFAFIAGRSIPIQSTSLEERPLGGTEAGVIRLAEVLVARGHQVTVFSSHPSPNSSKVLYLPIAAISQYPPVDVAIAVQSWEGALLPLRSRGMFYLTGDGFDQYINFGLGDVRIIEKIDGFLSVSEWQADTLCAASGFPRHRAFTIGNGVHMPFFSGVEERQPYRLIYASAPNRGLQLMPQLIPRIREQVPAAELHVYSGLAVYDRMTPYRGPEVAAFERLASQLAMIPGIFLHGNVRQDQLAREFMRSAILLYPNIIFETCCMVALEAQAAGCPVVCSRNSGLVESVGRAGILVGGIPGSPEYLTRVTDTVVYLLTNPEAWSSLSTEGQRRVASRFTWDAVATRLEAAVGRVLSSR